MNPGIKKFLFKLLLFISIFIALDRLISAGLDLARPKDYRQFVDAKEEYDPEKNYDIIFVGDSHTADSFVPEVFKKRLGVSSFNYGVYHMSPVEGYYLAKDILASAHTPRLVVLGTDIVMFTRGISAGKYTPELIKNVFIRSQLLSKSFKDNDISIICHSGRKNDLAVPAIAKMFGEQDKKTMRDIVGIDNGYLMNIKCIDSTGAVKMLPLSNDPMQPEQVEYFRQTIELFKAKGIKVVIVNPPVYGDRLRALTAHGQYGKFVKCIEAVAAATNTEVINYLDETYLKKYPINYFLNQDHLCYNGAVLFSNDVSQKLAPYTRP